MLNYFMNPKNAFYRKSLVFVLLVASVPTALLAFLTYYVGVRQIEQEVNRTHEVRLEQTVLRMNDQLSQLEKMVTMWKYNPMLQPPLGDMTLESFQQEIVFTQKLARTLLVMSNSSPLIREVRLFLPDSSLYVSALNSKVAIPIDNPEENEFFRSLFLKEMEQYWTFSQGSLALVQTIPDRSPFGYLLVQFNAAEMNRLLQMDGELQGAAFLLKSNGDWLDANVTKEADKHRFEYFLRDEVAKESVQAKSGSFFREWNGEKYAVSFGTLEKHGWQYVSATPVSKLTQPVVNTSRALLAMGGLGIAVAALMSWIASRRLVRPIARVVQLFRSEKHGLGDLKGQDELELIERQWLHLNSQSKQLHERVEQHLLTLRELFLFQLMNDHLSHLNEEELRHRMEQYGWELGGRTFVLMNVRLLGFSKLQGRFGEGDEQLVTFAAANVLGELAEKRFEQFGVVNEQELSVSLLLLVPKDEDMGDVRKQLHAFSEELIHSLHAILHMNLLIGLAKETELLSELPRVYEQVVRSFGYRNLNEMNQILDLESLVVHDAPILYPFSAEKELIRHMRSGDREAVTAALETFMKELTEHGQTEMQVRQGMNQLLGTLLHHMLLSGFSPQLLCPNVDLYEQLNRLREPDEMASWFHAKLSAYMSALSNTLNDTQDRLMQETVEKVKQSLTEEYALDISLETYCDRYGISLSKLSAGFKETTGVNFIDYLTKLRLDKSKELLLYSNEKVNDIAYRVGYQPSYYYRVFKKHEGVTPTRYREMFRSDTREA
ncbi:HTH-type transcriptional regulator YesS [Paenibacillus tyrfis]|uniref:helix-turn-helix domain-containing protein n=1 Tax=Paenibacillus tyrfis TaxID=1501230 RepID=UPI00248F9103|nr:AraC family transcriptional regulator [Paenibacillus tyrfis]GLI08420.1 HTH-type transcriptional regulator YesS [Paenibacillus tyrfis]